MAKSPVIVGIDEAGRGALAGPVVAAACHIPDGTNLDPQLLITDSKQMTEQQREVALTWITKHCVYGVGQESANFIDSQGILGATEAAMQMAVAALAEQITPTYLLVDGRDRFWFDYPHSSVIRGDESELCIAAASIIAKVTRDRLMCEYDQEFSEYGFAGHKGYGSEEHRMQLGKYGPSAIHRTTFLQKILATESPSHTATTSTSRSQ